MRGKSAVSSHSCLLLAAATEGGGGGERHRCSFRKMVILIKRQTNEHSTDCLRAVIKRPSRHRQPQRRGGLPPPSARLDWGRSILQRAGEGLEDVEPANSQSRDSAAPLPRAGRGSTQTVPRAQPAQPQGGAEGGPDREPAIGHPLLWAGLRSSCCCFSCILLNKPAILRARTLRLREGEWLVQGHTARTWLM